jgi:hypothetical protein
VPNEEHPGVSRRRRGDRLRPDGVAALNPRGRRAAGWVAVGLSTGLSALWAVWGSIESFHEGWYYRETWRNVALMLGQYLPWMFVPMIAGLLALWRRPAGLVTHGALAAGALWLFGVRSVGGRLIAMPVLVLGLLYSYGRPQPLRWARRVLVVVPLLIAVVCGAYPAWRVFTRPSAVDASMRRIQGDGVDLIWAPAGPGWDDRGFSWFEATRRCAYLSADGAALSTAPQGHWRLPTVDEVVRTQRWRGASAGGAWDAAAGRVTYRKMPDKEAPLWHPYSQIIYWWTASDAGDGRAYRIAYNGYVLAVRKQYGADYTACRCVRPPA